MFSTFLDSILEAVGAIQCQTNVVSAIARAIIRPPARNAPSQEHPVFGCTNSLKMKKKKNDGVFHCPIESR